MVRPSAPGEKPLVWVGSSLKQLRKFPEAVRDGFGTALSLVQFGATPPSAKAWHGRGPGVFELVERFDGDAYRAVYAVRFVGAVLRAPRLPEKVAKRD